eukprot:c11785_g1_i1 orf=201-593(-)
MEHAVEPFSGSHSVNNAAQSNRQVNDQSCAHIDDPLNYDTTVDESHMKPQSTAYTYHLPISLDNMSQSDQYFSSMYDMWYQHEPMHDSEEMSLMLSHSPTHLPYAHGENAGASLDSPWYAEGSFLWDYSQ